MIMNVPMQLRDTKMKECISCKQLKTSDEYYFRKDNNKYKNECKPCIVKRSKKNRSPSASEYDRERHLKVTYNMSLEDYDRLLKKQGGGCAICHTTTPVGKGRYHVDHDHDTGKVRGLLCATCNQGIGLLKDSSAVCIAAASYLKGHGK